MNEAYIGSFLGERALILKAGSLEAVLLPGRGANLIAYRDNARGFKLIREPENAEEMQRFRESPAVFGVPVLYPPNRYQDGTMTVNGKTYHFPINEQATGNHIHGFLHTASWSLSEYGANGQESYVQAEIQVDPGQEIYRYLPHSFTVQVRYRLTPKELIQQFSVENRGQETMPHLLGFHTALNAPFAPDSGPEDCLLQLSVGERIELNERMLPTGNKLPLSGTERLMRGDGMPLYGSNMDNHYTAEPLDGRNRAVITDRKAGCRLVYDAGSSYKFWMVWNGFASGKFICPEPQTAMVNAPNTGLSPEASGLVLIEPGRTWSAECRWYCEEI